MDPNVLMPLQNLEKMKNMEEIMCLMRHTENRIIDIIEEVQTIRERERYELEKAQREAEEKEKKEEKKPEVKRDTMYEMANKLKKALTREELEGLRRDLDTSNGRYDCNISVNPNEHYALGCESDNPSRQCLTGPLSKYTIDTPKDNRLRISTNELSGSVHIIYSNCMEILVPGYDLTKRNITNTIYPRAVSGLVFGYEVNIEVKATDNRHERNCRLLIDLLQRRRCVPDNFDTGSLVFSVSGKLPVDCMANSFNLTANNLMKLIQLTDEEFYTRLNEKFILEIITIPINLEYYFAPLLSKLMEIKEVESMNTRPSINILSTSIVNFLVEIVLNKIQSAARKIKQGNGYLLLVEHLQDAYKSFILDKEQLFLFLNDLHSFMDTEKWRNQLANSCSVNGQQFDKLWDFSVCYSATISIKEILKNIKSLIETIFRGKSSSTAFDKDVVKKKVKEIFVNELNLAIVQLKLKETGRLALEQSLCKRIRVSVVVSLSLTLEKTQLDVRMFKQDVEIKPSLPILVRPSNIELVEAFTNKLKIKWKFEDDRYVQVYEIDYRNVEGDDSSKWHSFATDDRIQTTIVDNIAQGKYAFKIQANFGEISGQTVLGAPSEVSQPMATLVEMNERQQCSICMDLTISVALRPCGHLFCESCAERSGNICPQCRETVQEKMKVYF